MSVVNGNGNSNDVGSFIHSIKDVNRSSFAFDGDRIQALRAAYALVSRLETPWDTVARLVLTEPALDATLKVLRDLKLFEKWDQAGADHPQTAATLAEMTSCDPALLSRMLRHLAATNLLEEVSGAYRQTTFTKSLVEPVFGAWIDYLYDATMPCFYKMPEYLMQAGYKNPADPNNGIFQYTKDFKGSLFDYYDKNLKEGATFNNMMGGVMAKQAGMLDIYPYERLADSLPNDSDTPLLVDVGGNVGHDINKLLAHQPEACRRLVLQDRPDVVQLAKCPPSVRVLAHDFFTPQPVRGARAYYLHGVIHDWSDEPSRRILAHLRDAMRPGYSRLLIHDHVLPSERPHPQATAYDLTMMVKVSAYERTVPMWTDLLDSVGLRIVKIWDSPLATQSVIEADLAPDGQDQVS
ncbi:S-adenosyl-L-methionine-dependent methyltransferase [Apiospora kogelbergensis]|uniref:S-adenosyl-L-methionine-dependent methyltransferase n=1 Tax=Apiospora kogelbergensis TaxID=1337665 RepID=UPI0031304AE9